MKLKPAHFLFATFTVFAVSGCGSSLYVNSSYSFSNVQEPTIALLPPMHSEGSAAIDTIFEAAFRDLSNQYEITPPSKLRATSQSKEDYKALVAKLTESDAQKQGLQSLLSSKELASLREFVSGTRFVYVPAFFSLKEATSGSALGKVTYQLYDAENGALILEDAVSINVMPDGSLRSGGLLSAIGVGADLDPTTLNSARYCVTLLADYGKKSLQTNFLGKIK